MTDYISHPVTTLHGRIQVPGDKSISHRAIMLGAIAQGTTTIHGFLEGDDCLATMQAFRDMGVRIEGPQNQTVLIHGVGKHGLTKPNQPLDCGNSGTSMRLLAGLLAAQSFGSQLTGDTSLKKRPMNRVTLPLMRMGAKIETSHGRPPLLISGGQTLHGIRYEMPEASAQVKSCLLLAGMYAEGETWVTEPAVSRDHTERILSAFSYPLQHKDSCLIIDNRYECIGTHIEIPGDLSSAAFFIVAATIIPNSHITIQKVGMNATRTGVIDVLTQMGANIHIENQRYFGAEEVVDLTIRSAPLKGITISPALVSLAIDEFPIIFIAAACAEGKTVLSGAKELRCKESDRISTMASGLTQLGIGATPTEDGIIIQGGKLQGGCVDSFQDHRIAMAFSIAGAVASAPVTIRDCKHISTSFPGFIETAQAIKLNIQPTHRYPI
jgi:3-phosphoshikimate 1-carboxyvinyltransferase